MENKQTFSIRKYRIGAASVLIGTFAVMALSANQVAAQENQLNQATEEAVVTELPPVEDPVAIEATSPVVTEVTPVETTSSAVTTITPGEVAPVSTVEAVVPISESQPEAAPVEEAVEAIWSSTTPAPTSEKYVVNGGLTDNSGDGGERTPYQNFRHAVASATDGDTLVLKERVTSRGDEPIEINKAITIDGQGNDLDLTGPDFRITAPVTFKNISLKMIKSGGVPGLLTVAGGSLTFDGVSTRINFGERPNILLEGDKASFKTVNATEETKLNQITSSGSGTKTIDLSEQTRVNLPIDSSASTGQTHINSSSNFISEFVGSASDVTSLTFKNNNMVDVKLSQIDNLNLNRATISLATNTNTPAITNQISLDSGSKLDILNNDIVIKNLSAPADSKIAMKAEGSITTNTVDQSPNIIVGHNSADYRAYENIPYIKVLDEKGTGINLTFNPDPSTLNPVLEDNGNGEAWLLRSKSATNRPTMPVVYKFFDIDSGQEVATADQGFSKDAQTRLTAPNLAGVASNKVYQEIQGAQTKQVPMPDLMVDLYETMADAEAAKYLVPKEIQVNGYDFVGMEIEPFHVEPEVIGESRIDELDIRTSLGTATDVALLPVLIFSDDLFAHVPTKREVYYFYRKTAPVTPPVVTPTPVVRTETDKFTTSYQPNPNLPVNIQNPVKSRQDGITQITTIDGVETRREIQPRIDAIIEVGTQPTITKQTIKPVGEELVNDDSMDQGTRREVRPGSNGEETITVTYSVDPVTGQTSPNPPTRVITKEAVKPLIHVGSKTVTTRVEPLAFTRRYVADSNQPHTYRATTQKGELGQVTITTTNGVDDAGQITKPAQEEIITVGTKPTIVEKVLPYDIVTTYDQNLDKDSRIIDVAGVPGKLVTTTTYKLNETHWTVD